MVRWRRSLLRLGLLLSIVPGLIAGVARADTREALGFFLGYSKAVNAVALSGRQAVSGGQDNMLRLWDIETGLLLRTFDVQANRIAAVAFSPDGREILTAAGDKLRLWSVADGQSVRAMEGHAGEVLSAAFSPDGRKAVSGGQDKTVRLWDAQTGELLKTFEGHESDVLSVAFSADGLRLLSASKDKTLKLWDVEKGEPIKTLEGHAGAVTSAVFSPDGRQAVSGSADGSVKLWDLETGQPLKTFEGHAGDVLSVALSGDGLRILSGAKDKTLKLWNAQTGEPIKTLEGHGEAVTSAMFSSDGHTAVSGSADKTLKLWDLDKGVIKNAIDLGSVKFYPNGYRDFFSGVSFTKRADPVRLDEQLAAKGLKRGDPVFLRIFKGDREVELWMKRDGRFELFNAYPICAWSGQLGPKLREGDNQAPEGFYTIGKDQLNPNSRFHRAFNLGYPNVFDRAHNRTGAALMVHGACASVGCYAMTDAVIDELWLLVTAALNSGQERVSVHVFPFRMTEERLAAFAWHPWAEFWRDLKPAYDLFEESRIPPQVGVCNKRYVVESGHGAAALHPVCGPDKWTPISASGDKARRAPSAINSD